MVTVSTINWVSARSGADSHRKVAAVTMPVPPIRVSAARRWYFAIHAPASAQPPPISQMPAKSGSMPCSGMFGHAGGAPASSTGTASSISIITSSCGCWRVVPTCFTSQPAPRVSCSSAVSKACAPLRRWISGTWSRSRRSKWRRSTTYSSTPPASATRLIASGRLKPCHTARS